MKALQKYMGADLSKHIKDMHGNIVVKDWSPVSIREKTKTPLVHVYKNGVECLIAYYCKDGHIYSEYVYEGKEIQYAIYRAVIYNDFYKTWPKCSVPDIVYGPDGYYYLMEIRKDTYTQHKFVHLELYHKKHGYIGYKDAKLSCFLSYLLTGEFTVNGNSFILTPDERDDNLNFLGKGLGKMMYDTIEDTVKLPLVPHGVNCIHGNLSKYSYAFWKKRIKYAHVPGITNKINPERKKHLLMLHQYFHIIKGIKHDSLINATIAVLADMPLYLNHGAINKFASLNRKKNYVSYDAQEVFGYYYQTRRNGRDKNQYLKDLLHKKYDAMQYFIKRRYGKEARADVSRLAYAIDRVDMVSQKKRILLQANH